MMRIKKFSIASSHNFSMVGTASHCYCSSFGYSSNDDRSRPKSRSSIKKVAISEKWKPANVVKVQEEDDDDDISVKITKKKTKGGGTAFAIMLNSSKSN